MGGGEGENRRFYQPLQTEHDTWRVKPWAGEGLVWVQEVGG